MDRLRPSSAPRAAPAAKTLAEARLAGARDPGSSTLATTAVQRFYRYQSRVYDWTRWTILHGRRRAVDALRLRPDATVLEVGCGTGLNFRHILRPLDPRRGHLVGLDFSQDMLDRAHHRCAHRGWDHVELLCADATTLDLGRRFDGILFAYSLTMIPDWQAALARAWEHLAPGARLVVLDFGRFAGWGPFGGVMRGWLKLNHVHTRRPYLDGMRQVCGQVDVTHWLGGYNFTAVARRGSA